MKLKRKNQPLNKVKLLISGKVQGVFFRAETKKKADQLGLIGWVRNLSSGQVETVFQGQKDKVKEMIDWCAQGSSSSEVSSVKTTEAEEEILNQGFEIRY